MNLRFNSMDFPLFVIDIHFFALMKNCKQVLIDRFIFATIIKFELY